MFVRRVNKTPRRLPSLRASADTYTVHYTVQSGSSADCPPIADETETVAANESFSNIMTGTTAAGGTDAGVDCNSSDTGCSISETCSSARVSFQITITATVGTDSVNGQTKETVTESAAGVSLTCNYGFTFTPG
jgi:hypothetical protein